MQTREVLSGAFSIVLCAALFGAIDLHAHLPFKDLLLYASLSCGALLLLNRWRFSEMPHKEAANEIRGALKTVAFVALFWSLPVDIGLIPSHVASTLGIVTGVILFGAYAVNKYDKSHPKSRPSVTIENPEQAVRSHEYSISLKD
jgi:hypothetical protein